MIPTAIPATVPIVDPPVVHDDTSLIPTETLTILPVVSTLPHTSLFLYTDSSGGNTSKRPASHDPYKVIVAHYPPNHSSSDDSSSDSLSDYSSDSSSGHSLLEFSFDASAAIFAGSSRKRCRSPAVLVPLATPVPEALSPADINVDIAAAEAAAAAREADVGVEVGIRSDGVEEAESEDRDTIEIGMDVTPRKFSGHHR
nr:hypothetical protein [Tanacetum cinerariifolium]